MDRRLCQGILSHLYSKENYSQADEIARKEKLDYLTRFISDAESADRNGNADSLWNMVRDAPRIVAEIHDERVLQIIDEFQFLNRFIFWDREKKRRAHNLAGSPKKMRKPEKNFRIFCSQKEQ